MNIKRIYPKNEHYFFGYYGICPWNKNDDFMLGLRVSFIDKNPEKNDIAEIILFDLKKNSFKKISETKAWNWQQGCMLQWMPPDYNKKIIFNDRRDGKFVSVIYNLEKNKEEKILPMPVYSLDSSGKYALSQNFARLNDVRKGYGYEGVRDKHSGKNIPKKDGIYLVNLVSGKSKLIISIEDLCLLNPIDSMNSGKHWLEQPAFSPDRKRFCFLHRWYINNELFYTRLFTADINGKNLFMFPDSGFYSHFAWQDPKNILVWCSVSEKFKEIRKGTKKSDFILKKILPVYRKIIPKNIRKKIIPAGYYLIEDLSGKFKKIKVNDEDGHPSFSPKNSNLLVSDTYPDSRHFRKLFLYDLKKNKKINLGKFYSLPKNIKYEKWDISSMRCDLHPRWNWSGDKICFDSVHEGFRGIYVAELHRKESV